MAKVVRPRKLTPYLWNMFFLLSYVACPVDSNSERRIARGVQMSNMRRSRSCLWSYDWQRYFNATATSENRVCINSVCHSPLASFGVVVFIDRWRVMPKQGKRTQKPKERGAHATTVLLWKINKLPNKFRKFQSWMTRTATDEEKRERIKQ